MTAGKHVKEEGKDNDLLDLIAQDDKFPVDIDALKASLDPKKYVGRAPRQVTKYLENVVNPVLEANKDELGVKAEINV